MMLEAALPYKEVVSSFFNTRCLDGMLTDLDWQIGMCFYYFLKVFYDATVQLSGVYYPTSPHALHKLFDIAKAFDLHRGVDMFAQCVEFMEAKFKKYWQRVPPLYCAAAVLDPRVKLQGVEYMINGISSRLSVTSDMITIDTVKSDMSKLYDAYSERYRGSHSSAPAPSVSSATVPSGSSWEEMMTLYGIGFGSSSSSYTRSELENYYETNFSACFAIGQDGRHDFTNFDLLLFWKAQSTAFPVLSKMARDILTTPVSTVASEQVFSSSGKVLDERRARLGEDILEALMYGKDWEDARRREQQFVDDMVGDFSNFDISEASNATGSNTM